MNIVLIFIALAGLFSLLMLWRSERVFRYRNQLIDHISAATRADIACGNYEFEWRYLAFDSVSYYKMFWQFWRPLHSFYSDTSFVRQANRERT